MERISENLGIKTVLWKANMDLIRVLACPGMIPLLTPFLCCSPFQQREEDTRLGDTQCEGPGLTQACFAPVVSQVHTYTWPVFSPMKAKQALGFT